MINKNEIRFAAQSLGCKTNQYEIDALINEASNTGYLVVSADQKADVYVLNSCTVTAEAGRKSRQLLRRFRRRNPDALIVCCGCHSELYDLTSLSDITVGTVGRSEIVKLIDAELLRRSHGQEFSLNEKPFNPKSVPVGISAYEELSGIAYPRESRAFLKIQDGCNYSCSYCATTMARGPARSRNADAILAEAQALVEAGYRELILTGTNLNSYGIDRKDNSGDLSLIDLLEMLDKVPGLCRIRLSSIDAAGIISPEFMQRYAELVHACPHFHLSLQSGSDKILASMRRRDRKETFREAVHCIRKYIPEVAISTDIIVGFPGETEEDFQESLDFCSEMAFSRIHVFRFSRREDTAADKMADQIAPDIKRIRSEKLQELAERLAIRAVHERVGKERLVLLEKMRDGGRWYGYTEDYLPSIVQTPPDADLLAGHILRVKLLGNDGTFALATAVD